MSAQLRLVLLLGGLVAVAVLLGLLGPILMPFVMGAALAYLGDPIVDRLEARKISRTAGVCLVFTLFGGLGLLASVLIVPMLYEQVVVAIAKVPVFVQWFQQDLLPRLGLPVSAEAQFDAERLRAVIREHWAQAGGLAAQVVAEVSHSSKAMITVAANLFMVPVVTFYLLRDWDLLVAEIRRLLPRPHEPRIVALAQETDEVLGSFITGQLLVMLSLGVIYSVGLWLAGLDLALLIGLLAGIVSFIPYLGPIVGILTASIAMLIQTQELLPLLWIAMVFGLGQVLESVWLTPWLVGDKIGLHPVAVIFAVLAGGQLFGFVGVMLALPVAAVIAVFMRHGRSRWLRSHWYQGT